MSAHQKRQLFLLAAISYSWYLAFLLKQSYFGEIAGWWCRFTAKGIEFLGQNLLGLPIVALGSEISLYGDSVRVVFDCLAPEITLSLIAVYGVLSPSWLALAWGGVGIISFYLANCLRIGLMLIFASYDRRLFTIFHGWIFDLVMLVVAFGLVYFWYRRLDNREEKWDFPWKKFLGISLLCYFVAELVLGYGGKWYREFLFCEIFGLTKAYDIPIVLDFRPVALWLGMAGCFLPQRSGIIGVGVILGVGFLRDLWLCQQMIHLFYGHSGDVNYLAEALASQARFVLQVPSLIIAGYFFKQMIVYKKLDFNEDKNKKEAGWDYSLPLLLLLALGGVGFYSFASLEETMFFATLCGGMFLLLRFLIVDDRWIAVGVLCVVLIGFLGRGSFCGEREYLERSYLLWSRAEEEQAVQVLERLATRFPQSNYIRLTELSKYLVTKAKVNDLELATLCQHAKLTSNSAFLFCEFVYGFPKRIRHRWSTETNKMIARWLKEESEEVGFYRGLRYFYEGRLFQAREHFVKHSLKFPKDKVVAYFQGMSYLRHQHYHKALGYLKQFTQRYPSSYLGNYYLAITYQRLNRNEAEEYNKKAEQILEEISDNKN